VNITDSKLASKASRIETTGAPIWKNIYMCSIAHKDNVSEEDLQFFGMPTVGDFQVDQDISHQKITVYFTINRMVELYEKGISFNVVHHSDTKGIYDVISSYLNAWRDQLDQGINIGGAPLDDLILLDRFATDVYVHAQRHFTPDYVNSKLLNRLGSSSGLSMSREGFFKAPTVADGAPPPEMKKHTSLAEMFSDRIIKGRGR
jgi:hypothetical protein